MKNEKLASFIKILLIIMIILSLVLFIYTIVFISIISSKVKKREINRIEDINISCFKSFNFIDDSTKPQYNPDTENLGLTGRLYLNCTSGRCRKVETVEEFEEECDIDDDCYYYSVYKNYTYFNIKYNCSLECYNSDIIYCSSCPSDYDKKGVCLRHEDDEYESEKVCYGNNIIYFWKGKKYQIEKVDSFKNKKFTYLNNAILKDENCSSNTKFCGILDDEGNKLCLPTNAECPPNVMSTTKLNINNYRTSIIDNKTVYYAFDENAINNKIIAGLYVDTDIYINQEENENIIILDTYTISGLLKENYLLYKDVNLGYDPYKIDNIDKKGKSYLKVRYSTEKINLVHLRDKQKQYNVDESMNRKVIKPIRNNYKFMIMGIFFYVFSFIFFLCLLTHNNYKINFKKCSFCIMIILVIFFVMSGISLAIAFININKFNKAKNIDPKKNFNYIRILNYIFIISTCVLYFLYLVLLLLICINSKCEDLFNDNKVKEHPQNNTTINDSNAANNTSSNTKNNII